jgi:hypothetical protein
MNFYSNPKTFYQAVMFGVVTVLIGLLLSAVFGFLKPQLPVECAVWDQYYVMEVVLFLTGFTLRYILTNQTFLTYMYSNDKVSVETA